MNAGRGRRRAWAALALALCIAPSQAALRLSLDARDLSEPQAQVSRQLLDEAHTRLPSAMRDPLGEIVVRWSDALDAPVHGHAARRELLLNRRLLEPLTLPVPPTGARQAALVTIVHELAHFYDRAAPGGALSRDPRLLDLAGWQVRASPWLTHIAGRVRENRFVDRSPDVYELADPAEFVAVNLEYVLLDPAYACRRPALYGYFASRLQLPAREACDAGFAYVDAGDGGDGTVSTIDAERVYQVDYLLAEGNEKPMSRWGHSMLRLVVCAPGRPRGPDCRLDLAYHRVLSFRAFVEDVQLSSWRGLTGRYPSRLFVLPLTQVVDEYTKMELRGLQSIPLRLSPGEIAGLLERAAQLHWSYDGRYYFLTNNCAVETYKLLHDSVPRLVDADLGGITPNGLLRRLQRAGLADTAVLDDNAQALRLGYRFDALRERFQAMYEVARTRLGLPLPDVEAWLSATPEARRPWIDRADLRSSAALLLLEQAALRREQLQLQNELKRRYLRADTKPWADTHAAVQQWLREGALLSRPSQWLPGPGYGLPQSQERQALQAQGSDRVAQWRRQRDALWAQGRSLLDPRERQALEGTERNSELLTQRVRLLHEQAGGLPL